MASGVEFDEDTIGMTGPASQAQQSRSPADFLRSSPAYVDPNTVTGLKGWVLRHGFAKNSKSAEILLLVVMVFNFVITFLVIRYFVK
jgi:hypothetical protein